MVLLRNVRLFGQVAYWRLTSCAANVAVGNIMLLRFCSVLGVSKTLNPKPQIPYPKLQILNYELLNPRLYTLARALGSRIVLEWALKQLTTPKLCMLYRLHIECLGERNGLGSWVYLWFRVRNCWESMSVHISSLCSCCSAMYCPHSFRHLQHGY